MTKIIYETDNIVVYELSNGIMTVDKDTGLMISWEPLSK